MTKNEFQATLYRAVLKAELILQAEVPVRSGLLLSSITLKATELGYVLFMDTIKAPHMVYTEEEWVSPQWGGRANPNQGWFREAVQLVAQLLQAELRGIGYTIGNT
jgi:hypothetical protein